MNIIKKQISLEPFTSRLPSFNNSYYNGNEISFNIENAINTNGNYGMISKDINFPNDIIYGDLQGKTVSWYNICRLYNFMDKINNLIRLNDKCVNIINNDDMKVYHQYGGDNTFNFLSKSVFNRYYIPFGSEIPLSVYDYWGRTFLTLSDGIKWLKWFNNNKESDDCCNLNEYENRGGDLMLNWLTHTFNNINENDIKSETNVPIISIPIYISNKFNNIGTYTPILKGDNLLDLPITLNSGIYLRGFVESKLALFISDKLVSDNMGNSFNATYPENGRITEQNNHLNIPYETFTIRNRSDKDENSFYCDVLNKINIDEENHTCEIEYWLNTLVIEQTINGIKNYQIDETYGIKYVEEFFYEEIESKYYISETEYFNVFYNNLKNINIADDGTPLARFSVVKNDNIKLKLNISPSYYISLDNDKVQDIDDYNPSYDDIFIEYGYENDMNGIKTLVLYKTSTQYKDEPDYDVPHFYCGNVDFNGNKYHCWRRINEKNSGTYTWGSDAKLYVLTKVENSEFSIILDYYIGLSNIENLNENIYVNRGYANAFKPQIALQEIKNMEALMQYGNNTFNIENE